MMNIILKKKLIVSALMLAIAGTASSTATPKFTIVPVVPGSNHEEINKGDIFTISYRVTNNLNDAKTLMMKPLIGVTQSTRGANVCGLEFRLGSGKSCILKLKINTKDLPVGSTVQNGPEICIGKTSLACSKPTPSNLLDIDVGSVPAAPLIASSLDVVTATNTIALAAGNREVIITNSGSVPTIGLIINQTSLPAGTTVTGCGIPAPFVPANSACTLTIAPGPNPNTVDAISPTPATLQISGANSSTLLIDVTVLTYGNIYQGGYVYKIDASTPPTRNVSGSIAGLSDISPNKLSWNPINRPVQTINGIVSELDGSGNTQKIINAYGAGNYAAYNCSQVRVNDAGASCTGGADCFSSWYLPAICEIGNGATYSANCSLHPNNMTSNLFVPGIGNFQSGSGYASTYWASTSYTRGSDAEGWTFNPQNAIPYGIYQGGYWNFYVRCARTLTA